MVVAARENRWNGWSEGGICWIADCLEAAEWDRRLVGAREGWKLNEEEGEVRSSNLSRSKH